MFYLYCLSLRDMVCLFKKKKIFCETLLCAGEAASKGVKELLKKLKAFYGKNQPGIKINEEAGRA